MVQFDIEQMQNQYQKNHPTVQRYLPLNVEILSQFHDERRLPSDGMKLRSGGTGFACLSVVFCRILFLKRAGFLSRLLFFIARPSPSPLVHPFAKKPFQITIVKLLLPNRKIPKTKFLIPIGSHCRPAIMPVYLARPPLFL